MSDAALDEVASKELLARFGVTVPRSVVLGPDDHVDARVFGLAPPLALKLIAPGVLHKSDVGGVALHLHDAAAVSVAMHDMRQATGLQGRQIRGFLLEEMARPGHEMVIGGVIDRSFGPVIMTGLGGIFVEIFSDVAFRVCPITPRDAHDMIRSLKGAAVLSGARGGIVADIHSLVDVLLRIGGADGLLMQECTRIRELDINPVIVSECGATAVDARVILAT